MKHLRAINRKARWIEHQLHTTGGEARAMADIPFGCTTQLDPGWEVDSGGGTYGLCAPIERDLYDCYHSCYWPAQTPDALTNYPDWAASCGAPVNDWASIDLVFP
jgi:Quinohemoprotein amine dehydrogenase, gamma subunit